jgi:predicted nucleic acid-binding protein
MTAGLFRGRWAFVDSSAYYALIDAHESRHAAALVILRRLVSEHWRVYTSNFIVAEAHALILNRLGHRFGAQFLAEVDRGATVVLRVTEDDEQQAREILARYSDKDFSLTDGTSFAIMERIGISFAFTFDDDFGDYARFTVLQP